jgi:hypothetical protein
MNPDKKHIKTTIKDFLNENHSGTGSLLNLIFSEIEIEEIYKIKESIATNYLYAIEIDPFANEDNYDLIDFINKTIHTKGIKINDKELEFILDLINTYILL